MAKQTAAQKKAAAKERELRNPLTGQAPNSYTQVTNRTLPEPVNAVAFKPDAGLQRRTRKAATALLDSGGVDAPVGYRMDAIEPKYRTFVTGAKHMFPNTAAEKGTPAINEPHEADPGVTVQRRAEDFSGKEYRKGLDVLKQYGHDPKDPLGSLKHVQARALDRTVAEHIASGVNESASQMFYGGTPTTNLGPGNEAAQAQHDSGVMAAHNRFHTSVHSLATHPDFVADTAHLSHRERIDAATRLTAQAAADTSPNTKWRDKPTSKYPWPNLDQADEVTSAAAENRDPKFISGRKQNLPKAADRVREAIDTKDYDVHRFGDPVDAAKTVSFKGALVDKDSSDAFKVSDVHEASVEAPWLSTAKSHVHGRFDADGNKVGHNVPVYADTPKADRKGLVPLTKSTPRKNGTMREIPNWGLSRPEAMLEAGRSTVHTLNDRATREVLADRGLSRSVDHADNVHSFQGATWGSQQMRRRDVNVGPADQYPVVRQWGNEGVNVPANHEKPLTSMAHGDLHTNLSPQFGANTRTGRTQSVWPEADH